MFGYEDDEYGPMRSLSAQREIAYETGVMWARCAVRSFRGTDWFFSATARATHPEPFLRGFAAAVIAETC